VLSARQPSYMALKRSSLVLEENQVVEDTVPPQSWPDRQGLFHPSVQMLSTSVVSQPFHQTLFQGAA
jgi:hypothetical protein